MYPRVPPTLILPPYTTQSLLALIQENLGGSIEGGDRGSHEPTEFPSG